MGAGHLHTLNRAPRASPRTTMVLSIAVGVVGFLTVLGALAVWPTDYSFMRSVPSSHPGSTWVSATVESVTDDDLVQVVVDGHEDLGPLSMEPMVYATVGFEPGDQVRALMLETGEVIFSDFERGPPMLALLIVYVVLVTVVAWWRGIGSLLGLVTAFAVVIFFTVPALFNGGNPLIVGLVTGTGALFLLLYLAHGPNARTTTAYLGTIAGLALTTVLAWWAVDASRLTGMWSEDGVHLELAGRQVDLQGLVLCGIVIAGMGVLNDVTVAQASAVWELRAARPDISRWDLFQRGMRIGRDHIASTVYTIAFVYVGSALPTIMLISLYDTGLGVSLTSAEIAEEVVRTLVGSIGLVLAVPLTTGIGAMVVGRDALATPSQPDEPESRPVPPTPSESAPSATIES